MSKLAHQINTAADLTIWAQGGGVTYVVASKDGTILANVNDAGLSLISEGAVAQGLSIWNHDRQHFTTGDVGQLAPQFSAEDIAVLQEIADSVRQSRYEGEAKRIARELYGDDLKVLQEIADETQRQLNKAERDGYSAGVISAGTRTNPHVRASALSEAWLKGYYEAHANG